jgi:hypothetical protein
MVKVDVAFPDVDEGSNVAVLSGGKPDTSKVTGCSKPSRDRSSIVHDVACPWITVREEGDAEISKS